MKFTTAASAIVAIAAAAMGAHAQGFKQACNAPYDVCGWTLIDGEHGYDPELLKAAASAAGQDPNDRRVLFDSLYNCREGGAIAWNQRCGQRCDPPTHGPNAECVA